MFPDKDDYSREAQAYIRSREEYRRRAEMAEDDFDTHAALGVACAIALVAMFIALYLEVI